MDAVKAQDVEAMLKEVAVVETWEEEAQPL